MFHIVFDSKGAELLNQAMDMDEGLDGEVISLADDYSIGPVRDLFSETGRRERLEWWNLIRWEDSGWEGPSGMDLSPLDNVLSRMREEEFDQIWIWMAPNAREVSGYFWLIGQLTEFQGRVYLISLNNLPFINEKGNIFYPNFLGEIPAREFIKAKRLARPVSPAEFETDPDEWIRLSSENMNLRLLEGGKKIIQRPDDFYDQALRATLPSAFQKISRTAQHFFVKSTEKINLYFLIWRLKFLAESGAAEQQGDMIRLPLKTADEVKG
jgi:hypothetical protein